MYLAVVFELKYVSSNGEESSILAFAFTNVQGPSFLIHLQHFFSPKVLPDLGEHLVI